MKSQIQQMILLILLVLTFSYLLYFTYKVSKTSTLIDNVFPNLTALEQTESSNVTSC